MDNEVVQEVLRRIDSLGELSAEGFEVLVQQAFASGLTKVVWALLWTVLVLVSYRVGRAAHEERFLPEVFHYNPSSPYNASAGVPLVIFSSFFGLTFFIAAIYMTMEAIKWLSNPEFYAIRFLVQAF